MPILITPGRGRQKIWKGNSPERDERQGFQYLGHSNWAICSPLSQFCSANFPTFSLSYWEANSYYPREGQGENEKRELTRNGWETGVSVPGAFKLDHLEPVKPILFPKFNNFFTFILERPILITPERGWLKMRKWNSSEMDETQGFQYLGHSNWTICSLLSQFCFPNFTTFSLLYWEANSYYPR